MANTKPTIILVLGSRHCGTTLLDLILDNHSQITGVGNFHYYPESAKLADERTCSCRQLISQCPFWSQVIAKCGTTQNLQPYQAKLDMISNKPRYYFLTRDRGRKVRVKADVKKIVTAHKCLYQTIAELNKSQVIIDSAKEAPRAELLARNLGLKVILLHLVRDGRGVTWSFKRKYGGFFKPMWWWVSGNLKIEMIKRRNKNVKNILVKYEDLTQQPQREVSRVLKAVSLEFEPDMLDVTKKEHHQTGGNRVRFRDKVEIREDIAWQDKLPKLDKFVFNLLFGWLNRHYRQI